MTVGVLAGTVAVPVVGVRRIGVIMGMIGGGTVLLAGTTETTGPEMSWSAL